LLEALFKNYLVAAEGRFGIMNVKLTGAMNKKEVVIQPAVVADQTAISSPGSNKSFYVYQPPRLVR